MFNMQKSREKNYVDSEEIKDQEIKQIHSYGKQTPYTNFSGFKFIYSLLGKKKSPLGIIAYSVAWVIIFSLVTIFENTFYLSATNVGFGEDYVWYAAIVGFIFLFILINKLYREFIDIFSNKIIRLINWKNMSSLRYLKILKKNMKIIEIKSRNSKILFCLFWFLSLLGLIFYGVYMQSNIQAGIDVWHHLIHPFGYVSWFIYTAIIFLYLGPILVWRYLTIIYATNNILKEISQEGKDYLNISPMELDRTGGLSIVGRLAVHISQVSLIPLTAFSIWFFIRSINLVAIVTLPLLIFLIIASFISLLYRTHDVMVKSRDNELRIIGSEMNKYYHLIRHKIKAKGTTFDEEANEAMNSLEKLQLLYQRCERMVTWPINIKIWSEFLTGLLIPIAIALLQIYLV